MFGFILEISKFFFFPHLHFVYEVRDLKKKGGGGGGKNKKRSMDLKYKIEF